MGKKLLTGYLVFCIVFSLALISITAIRVKTRWDHNFTAAKTQFEELNKLSSSLYLSTRSFESGTFLSEIRKKISKEPRLLLVAIYTKADGLFYVFSRSQHYLNSANRIQELWEGSPIYKNQPIGSAVLNAPLLGSEKKLLLDGLFVVFGKADLFPILKETFIILFVFFVATCIVLLIIPTGSQGSPSRQSAARMGLGRSGLGQTGLGRPSESPGEKYPEQAEAQSRHRRNSVQLFSPDTGLGWSDHLPQRIKFEIDRAAATDQDLILALISIDNYSSLSRRDAVYARIARMLLEEFTFQDLAFEYREGSYALIVPDTDLDMGISRLELFQNRIDSDEDLKGSVTLSVGLSSRNGRLVNGATLLTESLNALKRAQSQGSGSLIAFRADPEKYRDYVSKKA